MSASPHPADRAEDVHARHRQQQRLLIGVGTALGAIILAPYLLPAVGIGAAEAVSTLEICGTGNSIGLAGAVGSLLSHVPVIGASLAQGGWVNALASAGIGVGGNLFANYLEKKEDGSTGIKWSKLLRTVALTTSVLIAIPSLLSGVSIGLVFLGSLLLPEAASMAFSGGVLQTLGVVATTSGAQGGLSGASVLLPHLATCGLSFGSAAAVVGHHHKTALAQEQSQSFVERQQARNYAQDMSESAAASVTR